MKMSLSHKTSEFSWNQQQHEIMMRGQIEYRREQGNKAPRRSPGDRWPIGGAICGFIIGAVSGVRTGMSLWVIVGAIAGGIAGTFLGSLIGAAIRKCGKSRNARDSTRK
jgi:outer membrane lipoprotein SlyB